MSKLPEPPSKINDYLVLPLKLSSSDTALPATHYLYLRRHQPKLPTANDTRSLFAVNVPVDATEWHLRDLFSSIGGGRVERVIFEGEGEKQVVPVVRLDSRKRKRGDESDTAKEAVEVKTWDRDLRQSGSTAVLVFVDKSSSEVSLKAVANLTKSKKKTVVFWGEGLSEEHKVPPLGISRVTPNSFYQIALVLTFYVPGYLTHHNLRFPTKALLQQSVDAFMFAFAEQEAEDLRARARRREPDEDGFITVIRGGRVAPARQEEAAAVAEKKKGKAEHKDFYRFQMREVKKERHQQLLAKFEQDKRKVAEKKGMRKFRV